MIISHKNCTDGLISAAIARAYWLMTNEKNGNTERNYWADVIFLSPPKANGIFDPDGLILERMKDRPEVDYFNLEPVYFIDLYPGMMMNDKGQKVIVNDWYIQDKTGSNFVLDHHKSSYDAFLELSGNNKDKIKADIENKGYSDESFHIGGVGCFVWSDRLSGAGLTWNFYSMIFWSKDDMPTFVKAAQAADLFEWDRLENSREIFAGIQTYGFDLEHWTNVIIKYVKKELTDEEITRDLLKKGNIALKTQNEAVEKMVRENAIIGNIKFDIISSAYREDQSDERILKSFSFDAFILNAFSSQTELGEEMNNIHPDLPAVIYHLNSEKNWKFSMRSKKGNNINVMSICKIAGGGGHETAAGFKVDMDDVYIYEYEGKPRITIEVEEADYAAAEPLQK